MTRDQEKKSDWAAKTALLALILLYTVALFLAAPYVRGDVDANFTQPYSATSHNVSFSNTLNAERAQFHPKGNLWAAFDDNGNDVNLFDATPEPGLPQLSMGPFDCATWGDTPATGEGYRTSGSWTTRSRTWYPHMIRWNADNSSTWANLTWTGNRDVIVMRLDITSTIADEDFALSFRTNNALPNDGTAYNETDRGYGYGILNTSFSVNSTSPCDEQENKSYNYLLIHSPAFNTTNASATFGANSISDTYVAWNPDPGLKLALRLTVVLIESETYRRNQTLADEWLRNTTGDNASSNASFEAMLNKTAQEYDDYAGAFFWPNLTGPALETYYADIWAYWALQFQPPRYGAGVKFGGNHTHYMTKDSDGITTTSEGQTVLDTALADLAVLMNLNASRTGNLTLPVQIIQDHLTIWNTTQTSNTTKWPSYLSLVTTGSTSTSQPVGVTEAVNWALNQRLRNDTVRLGGLYNASKAGWYAWRTTFDGEGGDNKYTITDGGTIGRENQDTTPEVDSNITGVPEAGGYAALAAYYLNQTAPLASDAAGSYMQNYTDEYAQIAEVLANQFYQPINYSRGLFGYAGITSANRTSNFTGNASSPAISPSQAIILWTGIPNESTRYQVLNLVNSSLFRDPANGTGPTSIPSTHERYDADGANNKEYDGPTAMRDVAVACVATRAVNDTRWWLSLRALYGSYRSQNQFAGETVASDDGLTSGIASTYDAPISAPGVAATLCLYGNQSVLAQNFTAARQAGQTPPFTANVSINPQLLDRSNQAFCDWNYTDYDDDPQNATNITWYVNNTVIKTEAYVNNADSLPNLSASFFAKTDIVTCSVRVKDIYLNATDYVNSTSLTVENAAPNLTGAAISPTTVRKADILSCAVNQSDPDGDSLTTYYRWWNVGNNTVAQALSTNDTFQCDLSTECKKASNLTCEAFANDTANWTARNASRIIANTAPVANSVTISPPQPNASDALTCNFTYTDADNDAQNYTHLRWYVNGTAATGNISQGSTFNATLNGSGIYTGATWTCEIIVQDATNGSNSTTANSSSVTIGGSGPSVTAFDDGGTTDVGSNVSLNWTWASGAGSGPFTHTVCNSSSFAGTGCGDTLLCRLEDNASPSVCNWTANATFRTNTTAYLLVQDGSQVNSTAATNVFVINHAPNSSNVTMHVNSTNSINTYNCTLTGTNDTDADSFTLYYAFSTADGTALQAESTTSTYAAAAGNATHGDAVTCRARASDTRLWGPRLNTTNHTRAGPATSGGSAALSPSTITMPLINTSGITTVNLSLRDPLNVVYSGLAMTYAGGTTWTYTFTPSQIGTWTIVSALVTQDDTFGYTYLGDGATFTVTTPGLVSGGGGGGGGVPLPIVTFVQGENQTVYVAPPVCGDNLCQDDESATTCWRDCKVNIDTLITCLWQEDQPCNWKQEWFATTAIGLVVIIGLGAIYFYEIK